MSNTKQRLTTAKLLTVVIAAGALFSASSGMAATVTFSNFQHEGSDAVDYIVTIMDDQEAGVTAGNFKISYQVDMLSVYTTAKLTGFFFDAEDPFAVAPGPYNAGNLGLTNQTLPLSCGQAFNTDQVMADGGCNSTLNLGAGAGAFQNHMWDVAIAWKNGNDLSQGQVGMFEIAAISGVSINDLGAIGLRGQATDGPEGSAKEFQVMSDVPVPATVWLFGSALLGFAGISRTRKGANRK